jgi:hypothetical protein
MENIKHCAKVKIKSKFIEFIFSRVSFLVKSKAAQKKAEITQISIGMI